ncbi:GNAT family N-acetyltransferase [Frondihabitans australicus]|uniref:GNAT family N-acetyltransferase n=1 Tax=Frondihabitans australicus TaxID=386892 RepID=UPI001FEBE334|nr:GNAT family N-acetyltransferase [Frondihabitans australicus]
MTTAISTEILVEDRPWTDPEGAHLRCEQRAEIAIRYGTDDSEPGVKPTAADIAVFLVATLDGKPIACGGLRELHGDDALVGDAEIKRMFVRSPNRGSGASVAILRGLEKHALERGWTRLVLETGTAQPDARRFYEREGYTPIERFGYYQGNADSICYGKTLTA